MRIIDAFWEERNLGFKVCEITFDNDEIIDLGAISELEDSYDYLVAKIPGDSVCLVHDLENYGFRYLENQQVVYFLTKELFKVDKIWEQRFQTIICEKVIDDNILNSICDEIKKGLYVKGRIAADPEIETGVSDLRIVNWLKDLSHNRNAFIYRLVKDRSSIGYFALERINNIHLNVVQAGLFKGYQNLGYSFLLPYNMLKIAYENKYKGVFASISSNNIKTINLISKIMHFSIKHTFIVMRKNFSRKQDSLSKSVD